MTRTPPRKDSSSHLPGDDGRRGEGTEMDGGEGPVGGEAPSQTRCDPPCCAGLRGVRTLQGSLLAGPVAPAMRRSMLGEGGYAWDGFWLMIKGLGGFG